MKVVIVGNGVYTSGRGTRGYGTIIPAVFEHHREHADIDEVIMIGTRVDHAAQALIKAQELMRLMRVQIKVNSVPESDQPEVHQTEGFLESISGPCCAIVAVPDHLHSRVATMCIKSEMHTLVVKPLAPTVSEVDDLINLLEKNKLYGAVEFHKRFDRHNRKLKEVVASGRLGELLYCDIEYSQKKHVPSVDFAEWVEHTNIVQYLGVHYIDIVYFITGARPLRVQVVANHGWLSDKGIKAYDTIHTTIEWQQNNGRTFHSFMRNGWVDPESSTANSDQKIKLIGTKGRFESDQKSRGLRLITDESGVEDINPDFCSTFVGETGELRHEGYGIESVRKFLVDARRLLCQETTPQELAGVRPTFAEARVSTAVIDAVAIALVNQGQWVDVADLGWLEKSD